MRDIERILKSLANRRRLALVAHLKRHHEAAVGELATTIRLSLKATSKHLAILTAAELLDREQRSLMVYYRLADPLPRAARAFINLL